VKKLRRLIIKLILSFIFFTLLIILCSPRSCALASSSYFGKADALKAKIYFLRSDERCLSIELVPVECVIENDVVVEKVVRAVLQKLLKGPTEEERERLDLWTAIPENVKVNSVRIENKTVFVDFSKELQNYGGGSLNAICIRGQIEKTLREFPSIEEIVITVEGKSEENGILQP
jgi:spore germination protein GerM